MASRNEVVRRQAIAVSTACGRRLSGVFDPNHTRNFADFEVCTLEDEKPRTMQAACVETTTNIFVEQFD